MILNLLQGFLAVFAPGMLVILAWKTWVSLRAGRRAKRQAKLLETKWDAVNTPEQQVLLKRWGNRK